MGTYFLDKILQQTAGGQNFKGNSRIDNCFNSSSKSVENIEDKRCNQYYHNYVNSKQHLHPIPDTILLKDMIDRGENRLFPIINTTYIFQVDNYLNLYHEDTGLYLMLHKTTFPSLTFYLAQQYTKLDKDYYKIYLSKRLENINFKFDNNYYNSVDQRKQF